MDLVDLNKRFEEIDYDLRHAPDFALAAKRETGLMLDIFRTIAARETTTHRAAELCREFLTRKRFI